MNDVFISYATEESEKAEKICFFLEKGGVKCWIALRDIRAGSSYPVQILDAIRNCCFFLLLASERTNISEHVSNEIERAFEYKKIIIPFMLQDIKFSDEQIYFLSRKQHINAYNNFEAGLDTLISTIQTYIQSSEHGKEIFDAGIVKQNIPIKKRTAIGDNLIGTIVLDGKQTLELFPVDVIVESTIDIEYETMKDLNEDNAKNREQWIELFSAFPETLKLLLIDGKIVGFWHFVCLNDESFELAKLGKLSDDKLTMSEVEYLHFPGDYNGYFSSIAILPAFRSAKNFQLLIGSLIEQIEEFAESDIFITKWCTNAFTSEGKAICKSLKLQYICDNKFGGEMHFAEFGHMFEATLLKKFPRLLDLYKEHFK